MRASSISMPERVKRSKQKKCENKESSPNERDYSEDEVIDLEGDSSSKSDFDGTSKIQKVSSTGKLNLKDKGETTLLNDHVEQTRDKYISGNPTSAGKGKKLIRGNQEEEDIRKESYGLCKIFLYVAVTISVVVVAAVVQNNFPEEIRPQFLYKISPHNKFNYTKIFEDRLKVLQQNFPNQKERFWRILRSRSVAHLRNKKPEQPLVVLLGAPPSAHAVVDCFAKKLAWCLDPEFSSSNFIDGSMYSNDEGHKAKKMLDSTLKKIFQSGVRSALVMHLEKLPPPSPLLFYSYCDNDEAPYKHAGIIFTVYLPHEPSASLSPVEAEGSIETFLSDIAWSKYPYESDSISALLSRIADTVALVSHESDSVVHSACDN